MNIIFDNESLYVNLANSIVEFPNLRTAFDEYYKTDKYRFHEWATRSKHYNHQNMSWKQLEIESAMRRVFGVLMCADKDEITRDFVCGKLMDGDGRFAELVKNPDRTAVDAFIMDTIKKMKNLPDHDETKIAPMYFLAYLFYATYGADSENKVVNDFLSHTNKVISDMNKRKTYHKDRLLQSLNTKGIAIPKKIQNLIKNLKTGLDLSGFLDFREGNAKIGAPQHINTAIVRHIKDYYGLGREESQDANTAIAIVQMATTISTVIGIDLNDLRGPVSITNDEQNMIIKMIADRYSGATISELSRQISVTNYVLAHIFMLLMKEIRNTKEFYFKNNSETQYLEHQRLENAIEGKDLEIERLRAELDRTNTLQEQQREEIRRLTDELCKENKDAVKPYVSEIAELNARIRELEKDLESEKAKNPELNALREFAFAAQSDYIPAETTVNLAELIRDRKIIIVGGHVNWRNKVKSHYPEITFLDGHSVSLNNAIFDKADITLFCTSNMSHKLYDKIIGYLRDKKLKFDYLGKNKNQELLEAEMVSILQEKCD